VPPTWKPSSRGDTATATTTNPPAPAERSYLSSALRRAHASHRAVPGAHARPPAPHPGVRDSQHPPRPPRWRNVSTLVGIISPEVDLEGLETPDPLRAISNAPYPRLQSRAADIPDRWMDMG
jgi:hypothetical protein